MTYGECELALRSLIWEWSAGEELSGVDAAAVYGLASDIAHWIAAHYPVTGDTAPADAPTPATPNATTAAAAHE
jgi:hypothetical protein